jgi:hypothetical protein
VSLVVCAVGVAGVEGNKGKARTQRKKITFNAVVVEFGSGWGDEKLEHREKKSPLMLLCHATEPAVNCFDFPGLLVKKSLSTLCLLPHPKLVSRQITAK